MALRLFTPHYPLLHSRTRDSSTVGSLSSIKSTCLSVNNDKKLPPIWRDSLSKTSYVIPHRASFFLFANSFLFSSHQSSASHPSSPCHSDIMSHFSRHVYFPSLTTINGTTPFLSSVLHPSCSPSIHLRLSFPSHLPTYHSLSVPIIREAWVFVSLHQFSLTVNRVKNNSGCRVFCPGWDFRQIGCDGNGCQPGNCATRIHAQSVQHKYMKQKSA